MLSRADRRWAGWRSVLGGVAVLAVAVTGLPALSGVASADAQRPGNIAGMNAPGAPGAVNLPGGSGGAGAGGDFGYGYAFGVPPGRKGQTPSVGLRYTSGGAVHGGVAAGWSLASQVIAVDPRAGSMRPEWPMGGSAEEPRNFLGPDGSPLVRDPSLPVAAGAVGYRALNDSSFSRYEYLAGVASEPNWWRVYTKAGMVLRYGVKAQQPYTYAPLVSATDGDGHELRYVYTTVGRTTAAPAADHPREYLWNGVEYWAPGAAHAYARVLFEYADPVFCGSSPGDLPPVGSALDYRYGFGRLSGTRKLTYVSTWTRQSSTVPWLKAREYALSYTNSDSCSGPTTPFRELASVQETAYSPNITGPGSVTVLPPTQFTYGKAEAYVGLDQYEAPVEVPNFRVPESVDTVQHPFPNPDNPDTMTLAPGGAVTCQVILCAVPRSKTGVGAVTAAASDSIPWGTAVGQATGESMTRTWVDINGDNRMDMLERRGGLPDLATSSNAPTTGGCEVDVYLNKGAEGFVKNDPAFPAFSLRYATADVPVPAGVPASGAGELLCTLNRTLSPDDSGGYLGTPGAPCSVDPRWDTTADWGSMQRIEHAYRDMDNDGRADLVSQPVASYHCPYASTHGVPPAVTDRTLSDPNWTDEFKSRDDLHNTDAEDPDGAGYGVGFRLYTVRQTKWYVYRNTGSGFATTPTVVSRVTPPLGVTPGYVAAPIRLPADEVVGGYTVHWSGGKSLSPVDLTGDGHPDAMRDGSGDMRIWPGNPDGTFGPGLWPNHEYPNGNSYPNFEHNQLGLKRVRIDSDGNDSPTHYTGVLRDGAAVDINGDGLPDQIRRLLNGSGTEVDFNTGWGFGEAANGGQVMFSVNHAPTEYLDSFRVPDLSNRNWQHYPITGQRYGTTRMIDVDYDGLPDAVTFDGTNGTVYLSGGTQWVRQVGAQEDITRSLVGRIDARGTVNQYADRGDYRYTESRRAADLNGDGLLDIVEDVDDNGVTMVRYAKPRLDTSADRNAPARLLRTISNGYGAKTTVSYERDTVARKWLASQIEVAPGASQPTITTRHAYKFPVIQPGPYGAPGVAGYGEVRTLTVGDPSTAADDATSVTLYSFDQDPGGVPTRSLTVLGDAAFTAAGAFNPASTGGVMSLTDHAYELRGPSLHPPGMPATYPVRVVLPTTTTGYTCNGSTGQTANACVASGSKVVSETFWDDIERNEAFAVAVPHRTETRFTNADGVTEIRRADATYNLAWTAAAYRMAPAGDSSSVIIGGGAPQLLGGHSYTYHDAEFRQVHTVTNTDPLAADRVNVFTYHPPGSPKQGQIKRTWEPQQYHGTHPDAPGYSEYDYDANGVQLVRSTNPLGHVVTSTVDLSTGATLETAGPDFVCPDGPDPGTSPDPPSATCTFDLASHRERSEFKVDGIGRVVEHSRFPASSGSGVVVAKASFDDLAVHIPGGQTAISSTVEAPAGDGEFTHTVTETDGLGRAVWVTVQQDPQADKVVQFDYDHAGRLRVTKSPVSDSSPGTLDVQTSYDPLGRPVEVRQVSPSVRVLSTTAYDGNTVIASQVTGDGSPASVTRTTADPLGQLVLTEEKTGVAGQPEFAATHYRYDGAGRMSSMTDPDGVVTTMTHDYSGNRLTVTTGGRTWAYEYDRNGNTTAVVEPVPTGANAADYTHHNYYDDLNRLVLEVPAVRDLSASNPDEITEFKVGQRRFVYDMQDRDLCTTNANPSIERHHVGRLSCVDSPVAKTVHRYNDLGQQVGSRQILKALDGVVTADDLNLGNTYDSTGTVEQQVYKAYQTGTTTMTYDGATVFTDYDRDAVPSTTRLTVGGKDMTIANQRIDSGVVTTRLINTNNTAGFATPAMYWSHDPFGRVTAVQARLGSIQRYRQTYTYNDAGEIVTTTDQRGDVAQPVDTFNYTYDARDQLRTVTSSASSGPGTDYAAQFTHTPGGRMATADVGADPLAVTRVPTRGVTYVYQNPATGDPQRLDALRKSDSTDLATYQYDEAGNVTSRTLYDGTQTAQIAQRWTGTRLRKVTRPNGETETFFYDGPTRVASVHRSPAGTLIEAKRWFGAIEATYTSSTISYRHNLSLGGDAIGRLDGDRVTGTIEHYLTSPQGHHVLALDAAGNGTTPGGAATKRVASYGPYGEILVQATATGTPAGKYPREFNGKEYDLTGGLHYYGHRYYDPLALQWASTDPLYRLAPDLEPANPRAANLYTYTDNNPISRVDSNGLCTLFCNQLFESMLNKITSTEEEANRRAEEPVREWMAGVSWPNILNPMAYIEALSQVSLDDEFIPGSGYTVGDVLINAQLGAMERQPGISTGVRGGGVKSGGSRAGSGKPAAAPSGSTPPGPVGGRRGGDPVEWKASDRNERLGSWATRVNTQRAAELELEGAQLGVRVGLNVPGKGKTDALVAELNSQIGAKKLTQAEAAILADAASTAAYGGTSGVKPVGRDLVVTSRFRGEGQPVLVVDSAVTVRPGTATLEGRWPNLRVTDVVPR